MNKKQRVRAILAALDARYPFEDKCYLNYTQPHELLIATILSAQCTDDRVNIVTESLFKKYTSLENFAGANLHEMERDVHSTGFYRNKAKNIIESSRQILDRHGGEMPSDIDELTALAGVGRKTANVVRNHIFGLPAVVVDTHVKRISARLGLTKQNDPTKIEFDLMAVLPKKSWIRYNHQIIAFGREICKSQNPKCGECFLTHICKFLKNS